MKIIDIALTYEAQATFSDHGLEGDTRLTILIPDESKTEGFASTESHSDSEENEHRKLAILFTLLRDFEDTVIERFSLTREKFEQIREAYNDAQ
jgi:hypothetical protein